MVTRQVGNFRGTGREREREREQRAKKRRRRVYRLRVSLQGIERGDADPAYFRLLSQLSSLARAFRIRPPRNPLAAIISQQRV